ncbi:hypothetical protein KP509_32G031500 [Ceratopteris richardii]|uniref:Uncharacterized protein n=1 Tax=Ceratopteris richardii TaxID=49495 RepID=A0A8T2QUC3_CERRI|nr:hypothetical protein KP509_32G031500 [Ceratopteris richardii]
MKFWVGLYTIPIIVHLSSALQLKLNPRGMFVEGLQQKLNEECQTDQNGFSCASTKLCISIQAQLISIIIEC